jgi:hypothetical protein
MIKLRVVEERLLTTSSLDDEGAVLAVVVLLKYLRLNPGSPFDAASASDSD